MAFKTYTTYGKHRKRVVKAELWISPKRKAFSSCSDSENTASERENEQFSSNSSQKDVDNSPSSFFISRKQTSFSGGNNDTSNGTYFQNCGEAFYNQKRDKNTLFLEHSTPLSTRTQRIKNHLGLEKISPLTTLECYQSDSSNVPNITEHNSSSSLFSDTSTELYYSSSLDRENCKDDSCYINETRKSYQSSKHSCSKASKMISKCGDNDQNSSSEAQSISDKLKSLKLFDVKVCLDAQEPLCFLSHKPNKKSNMVKKESYQENGVQKYVAKKAQDLMSPVVTPMPVVSQRLKNVTGKNLSFVEALTPIRFQQQKILSAKEKILLQCEQEKPLKFSEVLTAEGLTKCVKVGEGTYGEVFKTNDGHEDIVLKIIPIEGNFTVNDEEQKSFEGIIPEIVISKELSNLGNVEDGENLLHSCPNFIKVQRVMLIQDTYPQKFLDEWDKWKKTRQCENERPDMFTPSQYFIVFEFVNGGEDLETFQFSTMQEALSVVRQIVLSLCVAEQSLQFEHRDLHWGNVLIKRTKSHHLRYKLHGKDIILATNGVIVSLIDFTLSRLTKDGITLFCDLSTDPDIFLGKGDYQFEVYRLMRKANENDWEPHVPYSNVLWIRYLCDKIINSKKLASTDKALQRNMRKFLRRVLSYNSALEASQDDVLELDMPTFF